MPDTTPPVNFYELLDIDLADRLTRAEAEMRVQEKRKRWNKEKQNPKLGWAASLNLEKLAYLSDKLATRTGSDAEVWLEEQRKEARQHADIRRDDKRASLKGEIEFAAKNGTILDAEITKWKETYGDVVSDVELDDWTRPYRTHGQKGALVSKDIEGQLAAIGEESLLSLVGKSWNDSLAAVSEAADEYYTQARNRATNSAEWSTRKDLVGQMTAITHDPARFREYCLYARRQHFFTAFLQKVETTCSATYMITAEQANYLLESAIKGGWTRDDALTDLYAVASQHGWRVLQPGMSREQMDRERGQEIEEYKRKLARSDKALENAKQEVEKAAQRLKQLRYEQARLQEQAAKEVATAKNDVDGANHRVKVIQQRLDALNQQLSASKRAVIEHYAPLLTDHLAHARLFAAQQIINAVEQVPPHWRANQERIEHGIAEAQRLLGEAHRAERASRLADAESLVDQALARCADLPQAQSFKASLRPEAPTHLETSIERGNVALTWKPSPSRGVRYIIVRSQGKAPLSERDGFRLATVGTCAWRDESVAPARRLWYAVFAERGSARSARAAISAAVLVVPDVADVQAEASDGAVELRWRLPRHAQSIRVVRNEMHAPGTPDDGQVFTLGESTHFGDTHLSNGRRYHYRIYCEYTGPDGDMLRSEGIAATSIPTPGLAVVPELTLSGKTGITNHTIRIDAPPPTLGTLVIYRTGAPPGLLAGTKVPVDQHKPLLGPDCHTVSGQSDVLFQAGEYFYTPVVLFQQMAYIGEPRVYRYCPPVRQPKATDIPGQGIEVCWTLPPGCDSAEVRCVALAPGAAMPSVALVPRGATSDAVYVARGLLRGEYTLHVLARYQFAGQIVYSSEKTLQVTHAAPVRIRYALQTQRGFMGRVHVELVMCADEPVARPGIQVVYGRETITSPADGHPLAVFADSPLPAMTWTMDLPEFTPESGARVYVFPDPSPQDADVVFEYAPALPLK